MFLVVARTVPPSSIRSRDFVIGAKQTEMGFAMSMAACL